MTTPVSAFDDHFADWKAMQQEPWMRLRYELALTYLRRHLPERQLHILDVGGGNGTDSIPLAALGHRVTIVDYSDTMLHDAREQAQQQGVTSNFTCILGALNQLTELVDNNSFDLVLCHNVLHYVAEPAPYLATLRNMLVPGGLLSIINPNPAAESLRLACQVYDLPGAEAALDALETFTVTFGVAMQRYSANDMLRWFAEQHLSLVAHYGIRCVCDYLSDNARKYEPEFYADLLRLETQMGAREPYRHIGRFMQLIAQAT